MRENRRHPDEEMLIVHKSATKPDPDKVVRARGAARAAQSREELEHLKRRAATTTDPALKRELLLRIQREFGNDKAAEVLQGLRVPGVDDDFKGRPKSGRSDKGKA